MPRKRIDTRPVKIPAAVKKIVAVGSRRGVDSKVLLEDILDVWGGPTRLALSFHEEFQNAQPGSMMRTRTLEMIQRLIINVTAQDLSDVKKPADLTEEELDEQLERLARKAMPDAFEEGPK